MPTIVDETQHPMCTAREQTRRSPPAFGGSAAAAAAEGGASSSRIFDTTFRTSSGGRQGDDIKQARARKRPTMLPLYSSTFTFTISTVQCM